ncbi:unnamed protein product [Meganyctiphanes norvegica]|uniref:Vitellogenin n=1 Tax=Meganyctiphanes norvegica TaxID=48144 RepID=A0AAV2SUD5_MEGNR
MDSGVPNGRVCKTSFLQEWQMGQSSYFPQERQVVPVLFFPTRAAKMIASPLMSYKSGKWCQSSYFLQPRLIGASPLKVRYTYPDETYLSGLAKIKNKSEYKVHAHSEWCN